MHYKCTAVSTFSPVNSKSSKSNGMGECVCVCVDVCVCMCMYTCVYRINLKYALCWHVHVSVHSICQYYAQAHILKPFEDSEPTGLKLVKVDT